MVIVRKKEVIGFMKYDIIYSIATDTIRNRVLNKVNINQNDTVSVLMTKSGATYIGFNSMDIKDGKLVNGCSEKDAVKNMLTKGESIISAIVTINAFTLIPVLPCLECVNLILGINAENNQCLVVSPNKKYIGIGDVARYDTNTADIEAYADCIELDPLTAVSSYNKVVNNSQYVTTNNGIVSQYIPQSNGVVSQFVPQQSRGIVSQYIPNSSVIVSQYMSNDKESSKTVSEYSSKYVSKYSSQYYSQSASQQFIPHSINAKVDISPEDNNYLQNKLDNLLDFDLNDDDISKNSIAKDIPNQDIKSIRKRLLKLAKERKKQAKQAMKIDDRFKK